MRGPNVGTILTRSLVTMAARAGCTIDILANEWTRWESATFSGARHTIMLAGEGLSEWLAALPEAEFSLRGHLVADIAIDRLSDDNGRQTATIGALTLVDR